MDVDLVVNSKSLVGLRPEENKPPFSMESSHKRIYSI